MENVALVESWAAFPKVTPPGPLNLLHVVVSVLPAGRPSSLAVPLSEAVAGRVIVWSPPRDRIGFARGRRRQPA